MRIRMSLLLPLVSLALWSCGGSSQFKEDQSTELTPTSVSVMFTTESILKVFENPIQLASTPEITELPSTSLTVDKFVQIAKRELASRLNIDVEKVSLVEAVEFTWPDAALGCPSPGRVYAQGRVPGFRVLLEAAGVRYDYHLDQTGQFVLCPNLSDENILQNPLSPDQTQSITPGVPIK